MKLCVNSEVAAAYHYWRASRLLTATSQQASQTTKTAETAAWNRGSSWSAKPEVATWMVPYQRASTSLASLWSEHSWTKYDKVTGKMTWNAIIEMAYLCCSYFRSYAVHECTPDNRNSKLRANDHVCCGHWISFLFKPQQTNLTALQRLQRLSPCTQFRYRRCTVDAQSCHDASSNVFIQLTCSCVSNHEVYQPPLIFSNADTLWHCTENRMLVKCWSSSLPFNISKEIEPCEICKNYWKCRHCEDVLHKMSRVFSTLLKNLTQSY